MVSTVQSELAAGNYVAAIQDALGDRGASATMDLSASQRTVTISGRSTSKEAVVISLSSDAQRVISNGQIALDLLTTASRSDNSDNKAKTESAQQQSTSSSQPAIIGENQQNSIASSPEASPSVADIVQAAQNSLSNPQDAFYKVVDSQQMAAFVSGDMPDDVKAAFLSAYASHTLSIQNAADVAGLNYKDNTVLTGTSESGYASYNQKLTGQQADGTYASMIMMPVIGALYFSVAVPQKTVAPTA